MITHRTTKSLFMRNTFMAVLIFVLFSSCGPNPTKSRFHLENAIEQIYLAKNVEAIEELELAIKYDPQSYEAYYYRGACKRNLKDYDGAIADYNKSIELNPLYAEPYFSLAILYDFLQDSDLACFYYLKAEELGKPNIGEYTKRCK